MDATRFSQPWLNVPMSGKDAQEENQPLRPALKSDRTPKYTRNERPFTYMPWMGSVLMGR